MDRNHIADYVKPLKASGLQNLRLDQIAWMHFSTMRGDAQAAWGWPGATAGAQVWYMSYFLS
jgi:hypothetical protein